MNTKRIFALLQYDWMLHKHALKLTAAIIGSIYVAFAIIYFILKSRLGISGYNEALPQLITTFCNTYFSYATFAAMFVVTTLLTEKFCHPRTATAYLTLPGTSLEKFVVMVCDYVIVALGTKIYFLVMFYLTMGICALNAPGLDWAQNGFAMLFPADAYQIIGEGMKAFGNGMSNAEVFDQLAQKGPMQASFVETLQTMIYACLNFQIFYCIIGWAIYAILCLQFKSNVQIKSIAICTAVWLFLIIASTIAFVAWIIANENAIDNDPVIVIEQIESTLKVWTYIFYCTPALAAGLLCLCYRMISRKQAK